MHSGRWATATCTEFLWGRVSQASIHIEARHGDRVIWMLRTLQCSDAVPSSKISSAMFRRYLDTEASTRLPTESVELW